MARRAGGMDADKLDIDISLVRRLVAGQFPQWSDNTIRPVECSGWDNRTFHLGERMTVRLPSAAAYADQVEKEHRWLPKLAPLLPLKIPVPLAMGAPAHGYPWHWSIYRWLPGESAAAERISDLNQFATALARFLIALHKIDTLEGPAPGLHNFFRGGPLTVYDAETRQAIAALDGVIDTRAVTDLWETALAAAWSGPPVWLHGDMSAGNLLVERGQLSAVIDFGCSAVGDPACDLAIAWTLFEGDSRQAFRAGLSADSCTWARARGWTLWKALITACKASEGSLEGSKSLRVIDEVLSDHANTR